MLVWFITLYIELASLIFTGGLVISGLFLPMIVPNSISCEQSILTSMQ